MNAPDVSVIVDEAANLPPDLIAAAQLMARDDDSVILVSRLDDDAPHVGLVTPEDLARARTAPS